MSPHVTNLDLCFCSTGAENNDASVNLAKVRAVRDMMAAKYEEMFPGEWNGLNLHSGFFKIRFV